LRPAVWNGAKYLPKGYELRVPVGALDQPLEVALSSIPSQQRFAKQHRDRLYTVRRGDSLSRIARRYDVTVSELVALNSLRSRHRIRAGQVLVLPDEPGARAPVAVAARSEPPANGIYHVRRGDTIARIAARFGLTEASLVAMNGLRDRNRIAIGQRLQVAMPAIADEATGSVEIEVAATAPARAKPVEVAAAQTQPAAENEPIEVAARSRAELAIEIGAEPEVAIPLELATDSEQEAPLEIAAGSADEAALEIAGDSEEDVGLEIAVDAEEDVPHEMAESSDEEVPLEITESSDEEPPVEVASAEALYALDGDLESQAPAIASVVVPAPDPSDYAVSEDGRITVQANETLGHYADWLEIPTSRLRRINKIRYGTPVGIGRSTKLDFSVVSREEFERRRLEYHHTLQEEFFDAYEVIGTDTHKLQKGDTLWELAEKRYRVPVWLLRQYNPTLDFSALQAGTRLVVPRIAPRES
jgi:membrane-bound lytic murein transglycosylase D